MKHLNKNSLFNINFQLIMTNVISIVGPKSTGKTTLVNLLASGSNQIPSNMLKAPDLTIDLSTVKVINSFINQKVFIRDCSDVSDIDEVIKQSKGIIVMIDIDKEETFTEAIRDFIDKIMKQEDNLNFVMLVANKNDLLPFTLSLANTEYYKYANSKVTKIEISCKKHFNITKLLNDIIDAAIFPAKPLIKHNDRLMKALKRIFRIEDKDNFGYITKERLNALHLKLCNIPLDTSLYDFSNKFSYKEFEALNKAAIDSKEFMIPWNFLYFFSYDNEIKLSYKDEDKDIDKLINNLTNYFNVRKNKKNELSKDAIEDIFSICDDSEELCKLFDMNSITVNDWIDKWKELSATDYKKFYKAYLQIGHEHDSSKEKRDNVEINRSEEEDIDNSTATKPSIWPILMKSFTFIGIGLISGFFIYYLRQRIKKL